MWRRHPGSISAIATLCRGSPKMNDVSNDDNDDDYEAINNYRIQNSSKPSVDLPGHEVG